MNVNLTTADIHSFDNEPRVQDLRLAEALGFDRRTNIRLLIKRHRAELATYGSLLQTDAMIDIGKGGQRAGQEYHLNEPQSLLACMFARTKRAAEARREIIQAFMEFRRLKLEGLPAPTKPAFSFPPTFDDAPTTAIAAKLSLVRETRLIYGIKRAQALWDVLGLPVPPLAEADAADEARDCLRALLYAETGEGRCLFERIAAALDGDTEQDIRLSQWGIRLRGNGFIVANRHPWLADTFKGTAGDHNRWPYVLRRLPGITAADRESFEGRVSRTSFVPAKYLDLGALPRSGVS